jgi:precorrin-2 dehydrogenase/sirohydrochlorin ferrochelatase
LNYPVLLNLHNKRAVVVGAGHVAARKIHDLLAAGAAVTVISPTLHESLDASRFDWHQQVYTSGILEAIKPFLVFAATNSPEVNAQVAADGHAIGALVNNSDFSNMASVHRGSVTLAVATGGESPALTRHLRGRLEAAVGEEYGILSGWLGELRPLIQQRLPETARRDFWTSIIGASILDDLRRGDQTAARLTLEKLFDEASS